MTFVKCIWYLWPSLHSFIHSFQLMHQRESLYGWLLINPKRKRILRVDNFYGGWPALMMMMKMKMTKRLSCCCWWRYGLGVDVAGCCEESNLRTRWYPKANLKPTWALIHALFVSSSLLFPGKLKPKPQRRAGRIKWRGFFFYSLSFKFLLIFLEYMRS